MDNLFFIDLLSDDTPMPAMPVGFPTRFQFGSAHENRALTLGTQISLPAVQVGHINYAKHASTF